MKDLTKLADALDYIAASATALRPDARMEIINAARILRAAGAADVAGLMAMVDAHGFANYREGFSDGTGKGAAVQDAPVKRAEIESALRVALAGQRWQPIETAPKDGRHLILLLTPSGFPQVAYSNTWWTAGFSVECKPTHWMPLPAAQAGAQEPKP